MNFQEALAEKKTHIVQQWIEAVMSTYSADGASFFLKQKDRFANPLGFAAKTGLTAVYEQLAGERPCHSIPPELRQFVKLRSVQNFSPSAALGFVYLLKAIVVENLGAKNVAGMGGEWIAFEAKIDALALSLFDLYTEDRELLSRVKIDEYKRGNHVMAEGRCPSSMAVNNQEEKIELKVIRDC